MFFKGAEVLEINKIHLGDCYQLIKEIPDKSVDLVHTDPPYDIVNTKPGGNSSLARSMRNYNKELVTANLNINLGIGWCKEIPRIQKEINCYIWCNKAQIKQYLDYFVGELKCNFDILIWNKTNPMPTFHNKYMSDKEYCLYFRKGGFCNPTDFESAKTVFNYPLNVKDKNKYGHPTIKPLKIVKTLIKNSTQPGDLVLDCFSGSGTTALASSQLGRNFIAIEIDEKYHSLSIQRLEADQSQQKLFQL